MALDFGAPCGSDATCSWQYACVAIDRETGALDARYSLANVVDDVKTYADYNTTHGVCSCDAMNKGADIEPSRGCSIGSAWTIFLIAFEIAVCWPAVAYMLVTFVHSWVKWGQGAPVGGWVAGQTGRARRGTIAVLSSKVKAKVKVVDTPGQCLAYGTLGTLSLMLWTVFKQLDDLVKPVKLLQNSFMGSNALA